MSVVVGAAAKAFQTATTTASGGSINPTDTNANPNLFGNNGPTPVIPAFVLSGVLLVVLVSICTWRRMLAGRRALAGEDVRIVTRYGPFGISFVPVTGAGGAGAGRRREEKVLGPKPELWDAYTRREVWTYEDGKEKRRMEEVDVHTWKGMKPLSLSLVPPPNSSSERTLESDAAESTVSPEPTRQPYLMRKAPRLKTKSLRSERKAEAPVSKTPSENPNHEVEVSVLIRMPSPIRPRPRRFSSDAVSVEKEKDRAEFYDDGNDSDDFNYSLGVATVPLVLEERHDAKS